jgi:uncharacterized protein (DUF58 family)
MSTSLRVVLILLVLSLFAFGVTGKLIYTRLIYLWLLLLITSWFWSRQSLQSVSIRRTAQVRRNNVGEIFGEQYEVRNTGRLPVLWLEVRDESGILGTTGSRVLAWIRGRQQRSYRPRTRLVQRGVFSLGPTTLISGDLFGLFQVQKQIPSEGSLLVYPPMVEIREFPNPPGLLTGGEALRRKTHQITPNAAGVREYVWGDAMSRIHWKSTARRDKLMVKEFELDPKAEVWIFLDMDGSVQAALPTPPSHLTDQLWYESEKVVLIPSTEEYAVSITASVARDYLSRGRAVGLVSSAHGEGVLAPDRGGRQLERILEFLALLKAEGELPLPLLIAREAQQIPRGSTVVVITPSVDSKIALSLDQLIRLGLHPIVVFLDAESFGGSKGSEQITDSVKSMHIPVCRVENGKNLGESLSQWGINHRR